MVGMFVLLLVICALIAVIWGRGAAQSVFAVVSSIALFILGVVVIGYLIVLRQVSKGMDEVNTTSPPMSNGAYSNTSGPKIGVNLMSVPPNVAAQLSLPAGYGVYITGVAQGSPAEAVNIHQGDVITQVNGQWVTDSDYVSRAVNTAGYGSTVMLQVYERGVYYNVAVQPQ